MSLHRCNPRRDANEQELVQAWRKIGATVWTVSGKGLPDVLVRYRGVLHGFEIKTKRGKLTAAQGDFPVVRSIDEAFAAIGAVR